MGDRKERMIFKGAVLFMVCGAGRWYVRFVVDASYVAPKYVGKERL
jgi:hypothetical protein